MYKSHRAWKKEMEIVRESEEEEKLISCTVGKKTKKQNVLPPSTEFNKWKWMKVRRRLSESVQSSCPQT